ncbi:GNAT family N-acetyltransferase [Chitinophaga sp.]|uniref:GNAT family N-acetyltransferase n=1 Tax=Chitinophaga sp. TaxID=1869181 RepID=UPI002630AC0C|nr:GNAT family N-acetyltransferase [uncultured Chitinophaga sp.]
MQQPLEATKGNYRITTDKQALQLPVIHRYLSEDSYWAQDIPVSLVETSIEHSLCFGMYHEGEQVGFARVVTDYATFGYLADVFVLPAHRGQGLSKWLMEVILSHPGLQQLRRMMLMTQDAQGLYEQYGFTVWEYPERCMSKRIGESYSGMKNKKA